MTCDEYQIASEQHRAGAPASITPAELDTHVAACASCAAYLEVSRKVSDSMMTAMTMSPAPLDLSAMKARIAHRRRQMLRFYWLVPLIVMGALADGHRADAGWQLFLLALSFGTLVGVGAFHLTTRRHRARLAALESSSGARLVDGFRAELDREIRETRFALWFMPLILGISLVLDRKILHGDLPSFIWLLLIPLALATLPVNLVRHRRLTRERALLGE